MISLPAGTARLLWVRGRLTWVVLEGQVASMSYCMNDHAAAVRLVQQHESQQFEEENAVLRGCEKDWADMTSEEQAAIQVRVAPPCKIRHLHTPAMLGG